MIIQDEVRKLLALGVTVDRIAKRLGLTLLQVMGARWRIENANHLVEKNRRYGEKRYRTEAYRQWCRERKRHRYHTDPVFRQRAIDTQKRYTARKRGGIHA